MDEKQHIQERYYGDLAKDYDQKFHRENANHLYKIREIGRSLRFALWCEAQSENSRDRSRDGNSRFPPAPKSRVCTSAGLYSRICLPKCSRRRRRCGLKPFHRWSMFVQLRSSSTLNRLLMESMSAAQCTTFQILVQQSWIRISTWTQTACSSSANRSCGTR